MRIFLQTQLQISHNSKYKEAETSEELSRFGQIAEEKTMKFAE